MITANTELLLIIASAGVYLLLLVLTWVFLSPKPSRKFKVELLNDGNVVSNYLISLAPFNPAIKYRIQQDGVRLDQLEEEEELEEDQAQTTGLVLEEKSEKAVALQKREPQKLSEQASNAAKTGQKAVGIAGAFASILGILGTILPGSMGRSLKARSTQIRNTQATASRKIRAPKQARNQLKALQSSTSQISGGKASPAESPPKERIEEINEPQPRKQAKSRKKKQQNHPAVFRTLVEELSPGDTADLELLIVQKKQSQIGSGFLLTFESLQQPLEDSETALAPVRRQTAVNFEPSAFWRWLLPVASSLILTAALFWILWPWIGL